MVEIILFNNVEKLIGRLGSLVVKSSNVKDDLQKLKNTMLTIKTVVMDAKEQQGTNYQVKDWLERLKDALDDVEDLLDDYCTEVLRQEVLIIRKQRSFVFSFNMTLKMKEIREKLEAINDDRKRFHFTDRIPVQRVEKQRQTHSFIREEDVIGREEEKKAIVEFLLNTNVKENVYIFSIIGIGGLGKTALCSACV